MRWEDHSVGKSLAKSKGERLYKTTLKKAQKKKRGELASAQEKDEAQIQSVVAERKASSPPPSMTLEEQARADELEALKKFYLLEEKRIKDKPKRILEERMRKVEQGAGFQILEAFFDKEQIKLDAENMMAEMITNALKAEREKIIQEKTFAQGQAAVVDAMAITPPMMEEIKTKRKNYQYISGVTGVKGYYSKENIAKRKAESEKKRAEKPAPAPKPALAPAPKPKAPTPPPKELTEKQKKEKAKLQAEENRYKNMTDEEQEAELVAYRKKKAIQKAKEDARKAKKKAN